MLRVPHLEWLASVARERQREAAALARASGAPRPPKSNRRQFSLATRYALAERHGCGIGRSVRFECRCGVVGEIVWVPARYPKIKNSRGFVFFDGLHVDHITPVSRGGGDDLANLQLLCVKCNLSKGNRWVG